jgi:hypothetical protein
VCLESEYEKVRVSKKCVCGIWVNSVFIKSECVNFFVCNKCVYVFESVDV